jgi:hypothetical protein
MYPVGLFAAQFPQGSQDYRPVGRGHFKLPFLNCICLFRTSVCKFGKFSFFLEISEILLKKVLIFFARGFILSVNGAKW